MNEKILLSQKAYNNVSENLKDFGIPIPNNLMAQIKDKMAQVEKEKDQKKRNKVCDVARWFYYGIISYKTFSEEMDKIEFGE